MVGYHWNTIKRFCGSPTVFILINIYNLCLVTSICTPFNHLTLQTFITESLFEWKEIHFTCTVLQCELVIGYHRKKIGHFVKHDFLSYLVQVQFEMCQWYLWVFYIQNIIQWFHTCPLFRYSCLIWMSWVYSSLMWTIYDQFTSLMRISHKF